MMLRADRTRGIKNESRGHYTMVSQAKSCFCGDGLALKKGAALSVSKETLTSKWPFLFIYKSQGSLLRPFTYVICF